MVRENRVLISTSGRPAFGASYYVTAYEPGAQVASASSGVTVTVRAGHGFAIGDKYMRNLAENTYSGSGTILGAAAGTLTLSSALSVSQGDFLVNLGADSGTSAPNYDGSGVTVYTDMEYANAAVNQTVQCDTFGKYRYHHRGIERWELVRASNNAPVALYTDTGAAVAHPTSSTDNAAVRWDGATGTLLQDSPLIVTDAGAVSGVTSLAMAGALSGVTDLTTSGTVRVGTTSPLEFRDSALTVKSSADGQLDIDADAVLEMGAPIVRTSAGNRFVSGGAFVFKSAALALAENDTTPSVSAGNYFYTQNTSGTAITTFDDGVIGQPLIIEIQDSNTDFTNGSGLRLAGAANWTTPAPNDVIEFIFNGVEWIERGRSDNS